jgi:Sigma-70 region 2
MVGVVVATTEAAFTTLAESHRRELHVHCCRMLGSFEEAEDLVQETLLAPDETVNAWTPPTTFAPGCNVRIRMPPLPFLYEGRDAIAPLLEQALGPASPGEWRLLPTRANRQPAAASYLRAPGDSTFRAFKIEVLRFRGSSIAEITPPAL